MAPAASSVPPRVRLFVRAFLVIFLVAGALGVEAWPLTGFRLFSRVRSEWVRGWQATTVDNAGAEQPVPFHTLPLRYHGWQHVAESFPNMSEAARLAACRAWADAARDHSAGATPIAPVSEVRIYATAERLGQPGSLRRVLRHTCVLGGP